MALRSDPWPGVEADIKAAAGDSFRIRDIVPVSGGCMHRAFAVTGTSERYFVKINDRGYADAFAAEADGLSAIAAAGVRAPRPICRGEHGSDAWLVMEHLPLGGPPDHARLGRQLAALHGVRGKSHGWHRDNYIGTTPQSNRPTREWEEYWRRERLLPQLQLAGKNSFGSVLLPLGEELAAALPVLLAGHEPAPSLLHGDLWGGNAGFLSDGTPVMFDPAVYFGDRETDLAMTELFGGFGTGLARAYREAAPLDSGYPVRRKLYNLYHILNHANLFGGGYAAQAQRMMSELLAETKR
jgi:protein-ribulosamine 3-kinase